MLVQAEAWKDNFRVFAIDFKRKFNVSHIMISKAVLNATQYADQYLNL